MLKSARSIVAAAGYPKPRPAPEPDLPPELESWVDKLGEPGLIAGHGAAIIRANDAAAVFLENGALPAALADLVARVLESAETHSTTHTTGEGRDQRLFQIQAVPLFSADNAAPRRVMISGREITLETNLTAALSDSRRRFKELVDCSVDFAWETDGQGRFTFVSEDGALGFPAGWLEGRLASDHLADDAGHDGPDPFCTCGRLNEKEVTLLDKDGQAATVLVSAVPIFGQDGRWLGARGVCRDITLIREHEEALRQARERERVVASLVAAIRDRIEPEMMVKEAAVQTAGALDASACAIMRMKRGNLACLHSYDDGATKALAKLQQYGERQINRLAKDPESALHIPVEMSSDGLLMTAVLTRHDRRVNGAICLARHVDKGPWSDNDHKLLEGVSDYVGIAIAQIASHEKLRRLSRTDELTGLLNRRGFQDHVEPRIQALFRSGQQGALIYIDLDFFKEVNDRFGHDRGDMVLRTLGIYLDGHIRGSDYCARLGGDEFALWLDNTTREGAMQKAERLLALKDELQEVAGITDPPLSMSLGIVLTDPGAVDDLNSLFDRADHAMYSAKNKGKSGYAVAEPVHIRETG